MFLVHELFDTVSAQNIFDFIRDMCFIISCNLTFIRLIDFTTAIVFKPIVTI